MVELAGVHRRHPARGDGDQRRGALAALQVRPLPEQRPRPVLGEPLAVMLHPDHPVQDEVDVGAPVTLADQHLPRGQLLNPGLGRAAHELHGQLVLQGGFHRGDQRLGVLVAPRGVGAEGDRHPVAVVGQARLVGQLARVVVDPVAGELARPAHRGLRRAVGVQRERQGGPHQRRLPLDVGLVPHLARCGQGGPAAHGLHEAHPAVAALGVPAQVRQQRVLERVPQPAQPDGGVADETAPAVAALADLTGAVRLDPGPQHIGKTELVRGPQCLDVIDLGGRGVVVVGEPGVEGHPGAPGDRFGGDPGD
jgi:hypothetical protein